MNDKPVVHVAIVNWNHGHFLQKCLDGIYHQTYPAFHVSVIDNASSDGSPEWIRQNYPDVNLTCFSYNMGFSRALNQAIRSSQDPFILSLNPDVTVRSNFLLELVNAIQQNSGIGMAAPKLLMVDKPSHLDSTGLFIDRCRRPYDRGQGELDIGQYDSKFEVFGTCGAAALYRRTMLDDIAINGEYFDEDFFAYYEDVDLSWRARLRDWRAVYAPTAVAEHYRGAGDRLIKRKTNHGNGPKLALRNRYLTIIKNDDITKFITDIPLIMIAELPRLIYIAVRHPEILTGILDIIRLAPIIQKKRRAIQESRITNQTMICKEFFSIGQHRIW